MSLQQLIEISRKYGKDPDYVLANGGNTSWKDDDVMYVKASGVPLDGIDESGFVSMDLRKLDAIWRKSYPEDPDLREKEALTDLMEARLPGESMRPSVEALLHALFPQKYVVHLHPALVNGMTCGQNGREAAEELFGNRSVWIPVVNPGYILAKTIKEIIDGYISKGNAFPGIVFLQNHGVFAAADSIREIDRIYEDIISVLDEQIDEYPDLHSLPADTDGWEKAVRRVLDKPDSAFLLNREISLLVESSRDFDAISSAYTPDHIVYYGHKPLFIERGDSGEDVGNNPEELIGAALKEYRKEYPHNPPRIVAVQGIGVFAAGDSAKRVTLMTELFNDAVKISVYTRAFGGPNFMPKDKIDFIVNWEVEKYRSSMQDN